MDSPEKALCVIPSRLGINEEFAIKLKLKGQTRVIPCSHFAWQTKEPQPASPFNLAAGRDIKFVDDTLPEWQGILEVEGGNSLNGNSHIEFDGKDQGVFPGDTRAIKEFPGYSWSKPGFHFIKITDPATGQEFLSNPVYVSTEKPVCRIFWGDPHWQTIFSDGVRSPEELYGFARDEAFLDFGAISDHMEAVTQRQWEYFQAVTNDYNEPGRFATLIGQEWTHHQHGHRNIYYRADNGPLVSSKDPDSDTLDKLWRAADKIAASGNEVLLIPHHSANKIMGCDWALGWNPKYEKALEIYSCWGSSECHQDEGNTRPIHHCQGEIAGRHARSALDLGYRFGFVGGGDIHDGRPGDCLDGHSNVVYQSGLTAVITPGLTRENVFDAIKQHQCYAATCSRIYLDVWLEQNELAVKCASEHGLEAMEVIRNGIAVESISPGTDARVIETSLKVPALSGNEYLYVRVTTKKGDIAWSSPVFANGEK